MVKQKLNIKIDPEFKSLIPSLAPDEFEQLERNILEEGCRDDIVVWMTTTDDDKQISIIIDGHNRYEICTKHNLEFDITTVLFPKNVSRDDIKLWIIKNQLGRRNLSQEQIEYFRGKQYEAEKKTTTNEDGKNQHTEVEAQNDPQPKKQTTAERLGEQYNVSSATIKRDAKFTKGVDVIGEVSPVAKQIILSGNADISKQDVVKLASKPKEEVKAVATAIVDGTYTEYQNKTKTLNVEVIETKTAQDEKLKNNDYQHCALANMEHISNMVNAIEQNGYYCDYSNEIKNNLEHLIPDCIAKLNDFYKHITELTANEKIVEQDKQQKQEVTEIDSQEYRTKILQENKEQLPISKIFFLFHTDTPRRNFYRQLEQELGLCDKDDKILLSYEDYEMFITEYDPNKANEPERTKSRINKIKDAMKSA